MALIDVSGVKSEKYGKAYHFHIINTGETPNKHVNKHVRRTIWKGNYNFHLLHLFNVETTHRSSSDPPV